MANEPEHGARSLEDLERRTGGSSEIEETREVIYSTWNETHRSDDAALKRVLRNTVDSSPVPNVFEPPDAAPIQT